MQKKQWLKSVVCLALVRALVITAYAQEATVPSAVVNSGHTLAAHGATHRFGGASKGLNGFAGKMEKAVGLTPEQRDAVRGLMAEQRQQHTAIQEQTDAKIRALLSADQKTKFDAFLAQQKQERSARFRRAS